MTFTADSASLAFGEANGKVRLWHLQAARTPSSSVDTHPKEAWSVAFSPDGKTLASGGDDHRIRLWDLETGQEKAVLRGHYALVSSVAFAPDGRTLASASYDTKAPCCPVGRGDGDSTVRASRTHRLHTFRFFQPGWPHPRLR